jgi:hypothetical protein
MIREDRSHRELEDLMGFSHHDYGYGAVQIGATRIDINW